MTAISQPSPDRLTTTPPAEISLTMAPKLTGMRELVMGEVGEGNGPEGNTWVLTDVPGTNARKLASYFLDWN